jgi:hypothetical protein
MSPRGEKSFTFSPTMSADMGDGPHARQVHMKKWIVGALGGAGLVVALSTPAVATAGAAMAQASPCGANHGAFADVNAPGGFGQYVGGEGPTIVHSEAHGQQLGAAGSNNSDSGCHA